MKSYATGSVDAKSHSPTRTCERCADGGPLKGRSERLVSRNRGCHRALQRVSYRCSSAVVVLCLVVSIGATVSETLPSADRPQNAGFADADRHFQTQEWEAAARAYEAIVEAEPSSARAWFRLGLSRRRLSRFEGALTAYQQAEKAGVPPAFTRYNAAADHARLNQPAAAMEALEQALEAGFSDVASLRTNSDLETLRDGSGFAAVVSAADRNARPCEYDPAYRQFDFWVGDWEVFTPQGQRAGSNRISKILQGCALQEEWTSANGSRGHSINYYDPSTENWRQLWVDDGGGIIPIEGELIDKAMVFVGSHILQDGSVRAFRERYTPLSEGRVRQLLEESVDGGVTWYTWFDGDYRRVGASDAS